LIKGLAGSLPIEQSVSAGKTVTLQITPTQPCAFPIYCDKYLWPMRTHRNQGMDEKLEAQ
jgi:hypothetical protein